MTIEQALDTALKAASGVTAVFSTRIYWMNAPEEATAPYLVYYTVVDADVPLHFGNTNTGEALVQFDAVGVNKSVKTGLYAVRTLLRGQSGTIGGATIYRVEPSAIREIYNADTKRYVFSAEYKIAYSY